MALLDLADRAGVPYAAVTNAPRLNAEMMLAGLGIAHRFKALVIGDELPARQAASPALSGGPARCSARRRRIRSRSRIPRSGVQSATAAGIATVGMLTSLTADSARGGRGDRRRGFRG